MSTPKAPFRSLLFHCLAGVFLACLWTSPVFGQTWTGSANGEWTNSANWNPASVPGSGNSVLFDSAGGGNTLIDLSSSPITVKNIEFNSSSCAAYTIGTTGQQLHLNGPEYGHGAITVDAGVTQNQTFAADLRLNGDGSLKGIYNIVNNSSASLNITGTIAPSGGSNYYLSLMGSGSGINTLSGVLSDGDTMVEMQVNVLGGTWALTGANTFGGAVVIQGGTLVANTINNGSQASSLGNSYTQDTNLCFNGNSGTVSTLRYTGETTSTDRNFWIDDNVTATFDVAGGDLTFTGGVKTSCSGSIVKTGAGMLALNGTSYYSGATILREGTLSANDLQNGGHDSSIGKSSSAASNLVFDGGTLQYTGGSTSIDRSFAISNGKAAVFDISDPGTALKIDSVQPAALTTGGLTKTGQGTLVLAGFSSYTGPTTVSGGTLRAGVNTVYDDGPFGVASETTIMAAGTLDLDGFAVTIGSLTGQAGSRVLIGVGTLTTGSSANATFEGVISGNSGAFSGGVVKTGAGMQTFTGNNTYSGPTAIQGGGITLSGGSIAASTSISISNNATLAAVNYGSNTPLISTTAPVTMSGGTLSFQIASSGREPISATIGNLTVTGGYNTIGNAEAVELGSTSTLTIASLTRTGNAIVNFSGENLGDPRNQIFFTNAPTLGQWALYNGVGYATYNATLGIVEAAYDNVTRLSSGPKVICSAPQGNIRVIDGTGDTATPITLNDATTTISTLTQNATGGTVTIDTTGKTFALSSALVGNGTSPLLIGTGANNGNLTSSSGALTLVNYSADSNLVVNSTVVGSIDVKMSGPGTAVLAGTNTYTGVTTLEQGVLSVATIGNGGTPGNLGAAGNATANIVFAGGTLRYTGNDTTTDRGFTVMSGGSRFETSANFEFSGAGINLSSGSITIGGTGNTTITGIMSGSGALAKDGASTLTLQGMNTFTGGVTISGGFVSVTSIGNGGQAGNLGAATNASANLVLDGGTLVYHSSGITGCDRGMTVTANGGTFVNANANSTLFLANGSPVSIAQNGVFTVDGPGSAVIGNALFGAGALQKTGDGQLFLDNPVNSFTGGVTISGGTLGVAAISNGGVAGYLGAATAAASNLVFDGGTLAFDPNTSATLTSNRSFSITANKTATFNMWDSSSLRLTGSVPATTGGLTKTGNGTLTLAGNMLFAGPAIVSAGRLNIDGTLGPGTYPSDSVYALSGATLGGSGTIQRAVCIYGTHSPGSSGPGVQTIDGAVVYYPGANVDWKLAASTTDGRGTNYDGITGNYGVAHFYGNTTLTLIFNAPDSTVKWSDDFWSTGHQWVVYSNFFMNGFDYFSIALENWADSTGALFNTALSKSEFTISSAGTDIYLNYAGVPEPSTYALLALGALALACARLRKKTAR